MRLKIYLSKRKRYTVGKIKVYAKEENRLRFVDISPFISRNALYPGLNRDYSILDLADSIKSLNNNGTFQYMMDAHSRRHWGGIFEAPKSYRWENSSRIVLV